MAAQVVLGATVLAALALVVQAQPKSSFLSDTRQPAALGITEATVSAGKGSLASLPSARSRYLTVGRQVDAGTTVLIRIPLTEVAAR